MAAEAVLATSDLVCGYEEDAPVVEGDLRMARGEIVAIVGGSGSGKSTLLKTLSGLLPPLAGRVEMFGENLFDLGAEARRELLQRTGMVFQHDALLGSLTLIDNVALPIRQHAHLPDRLTREIARALLSLVGVGDLGHRLPSKISGGQRKRAAIARALVLDPKLLFCDEPTAGLDPITAARVDETLLRLRDAFGVAILAVTHDVASVRTIADRVIMVGDGRVRPPATVDELSASDDPVAVGFFHRGAKDDRERRRSWRPAPRR